MYLLKVYQPSSQANRFYRNPRMIKCWTLCFWILRILRQSLQTEPINNMESAWLSIPQFIFHREVNRWSKRKGRSSSSSSSSDSSTISLTGGLSQVWAAFFTERLGHYISWSRSRPHPWVSNTVPFAQCVATEGDWSLWSAAAKWSLLAVEIRLLINIMVGSSSPSLGRI